MESGLGSNGRYARDRTQKSGLAQMLRDVFIASINKGQFPPALVGFIAALVILKMPAADVSRLMFRLLDFIERAWAFGYLSALAAVSAWFWHSRWQRRLLTQETRRANRLSAGLQKLTREKKPESTEARQ